MSPVLEIEPAEAFVQKVAVLEPIMFLKLKIFGLVCLFVVILIDRFR